MSILSICVITLLKHLIGWDKRPVGLLLSSDKSFQAPCLFLDHILGLYFPLLQLAADTRRHTQNVNNRKSTIKNQQLNNPHLIWAGHPDCGLQIVDCGLIKSKINNQKSTIHEPSSHMSGPLHSGLGFVIARAMLSHKTLISYERASTERIKNFLLNLVTEVTKPSSHMSGPLHIANM